MTIRDPAKFVESMWNWAVLRGCFGETKIEPTDIDGAVERNGRLLILETKLPGNDIPTGQHITFTHLAATGFVTAFVIWGEPGKPQKLKIYYGKSQKEFADCTLDFLREKVSVWFTWACTQTPPIPFSGGGDK